MDAQSTKVFMADDDRMLRKAAETTLRRCGYAVSTASDGEEALRLIRAERPHLVVLDLIMPKVQGFDVLQALKQDVLTSSIPVIVLSSLAQERDRQEALDLGAFAASISPLFRWASRSNRWRRHSLKQRQGILRTMHDGLSGVR